MKVNRYWMLLILAVLLVAGYYFIKEYNKSIPEKHGAKELNSSEAEKLNKLLFGDNNPEDNSAPAPYIDDNDSASKSNLPVIDCLEDSANPACWEKHILPVPIHKPIYID